MTKNRFFISIGIFFFIFSCEKQIPLPQFKPTDVIVMTKSSITINQVFDFIDTLEHDVEKIYNKRYYSNFPHDSLQYVSNYLSSKTYLDDEYGNWGGKAVWSLQTQKIITYPWFFQIKNTSYQADWLQTVAAMQLTEEDNSTSGWVILFHVPEGKEIEWVNKFKKFDFIEWAELNYSSMHPHG